MERRPKLGASTLSWITPDWTDDAGRYAIEQAAKAGFDLIEILLPIDLQIDAKATRQTIVQNNIGIVCGLNLNKEFSIPANPRGATQLLRKALDITETLGSTYLGGVLHGGIGAFTGHQRTKSEEDILVNVWGELAGYATTKGIIIGIEPINRYESYVCTSAAEVLELTARTGAANLQLHLDTFHMNIEENDFYHPVVAAGDRLHHVHMTESDRGMPGEGNVHWDDLFRGLAEIGFAHNLVLENFSNSIPGMAAATSLWRPSKYDAKELAQGSLKFMQEMLDKWY